MKVKFLILLIITLFFENTINADEMRYNDKYVYSVSEGTDVRQKSVKNPIVSSSDVQGKVIFDDNVKIKIYIKNQLKNLEKTWKKEDILNRSKYKLSYARVMFFVDGSGNIRSYKIKSSCVPSGDTEFIRVVNNYIRTIKFDSLPKAYKNKVVAFTIKFNSFIPSDYTVKRVTSAHYGVADLEISKNKAYFIMSAKK